MKPIKVFKSDQGRKLLFESYDRLLGAWGVELTERDLDTSWGKTHVILAGDPANPPLLLFHGVGDNSALMWICNAKALTERFRIVAIDNLGGAGKSLPDERYRKSYDTARWQGEIMKALGLSKVYAAGVSYGSYMVQLLAVSYPDQVIKFVGISGAISSKGARHATLRRMIAVFLPAILLPGGKTQDKLLKALTGPKRDEFIKRYPELMTQWTLLLSQFNQGALRFHKRRELADREIEAFRDKSLFLIGEYDTMFYKQAMASFKKYRIHYQLFQGVGHTLNHEEPEIANQAIIDFLLER